MAGNESSVTAFLRRQRDFSNDINSLPAELNRAYIDLANYINNREIGVYVSNIRAYNGQSWYLANNRKQDGLRSVYPITGPGSYPHNIDLTQINAITNITGTATNGTNWYPLPLVNTASALNQISVVVTPTNIVVTAGAGAPVITSGTIVLEWISNP